MAAGRAAAAGQGRRSGAERDRQPAVRQRGAVGAQVGRTLHDLPERYGKWKTLHKRFSRWSKAKVWERVFDDLTRDRDNQYLMLDSTLVRVHQQQRPEKGGQDQALGRSRGGLTTKIHMLADTLGRAPALSAGTRPEPRHPGRPAAAAGLHSQGRSRRPCLRLHCLAQPHRRHGSRGGDPLNPIALQCPSHTIRSSTDAATASSDASTSSKHFRRSPPATIGAPFTSSPSSTSPLR